MIVSEMFLFLTVCDVVAPTIDEEDTVTVILIF
jgi:hypothetical protein